MASVDAISLASLGTRRTGPGVVAAPARPSDAPSNELPVHGLDLDDVADDFHSTPALPPVSRSQQASVLAASFLAIALSIGYNQCYGVFQEYYESDGQDVLRVAPGEPKPSTALLAFVGTLGAGLTWAGSIFVNPWLSRVEHAAAVSRNTAAAHTSLLLLSPRGITMAGVALMALGFFLASFSTKVWHLLLTQGLLYGIGSSMLYFPLLGPAPEYFSRHRGTALGIILSGGGVGSVVLSPLVRALTSSIGGRWTLRSLAALDLVVGLPVAWAVPPSRFPSVVASDTDDSGGSGGSTGMAAAASSRIVARRRTHVSAALLTTPAFLLSVVAAFCQSAGAQLPLSFIPSYSVALGLSAGTGATLLAVSNIVNSVARVATGYAGDRFGRLNVLSVSLAGAAIAVGALWGTSVKAAGAELVPSSTSGPVQLWMAFIVLYSIAAGGYYALFPATIADVFGIRSYAAVNGFIYFVRGCGTMLGSPVGGVLLASSSSASSSVSSSSSASYADVVVWDGALIAGSVVCILGVRWADALRRGWAWRA